jgi:DNA-binding NarL/FixJ family response regulator
MNLANQEVRCESVSPLRPALVSMDPRQFSKTQTKPQTTSLASARRRVLLAGNDAFLAWCLRLVINNEPDLVVCGQIKTNPDSLRTVGDYRADTLLLDIGSDPVLGLSLAKDLVQGWPSLPVIVLSNEEEALYARCAFDLGAKGYVWAFGPPEEMLATLRRAPGEYSHSRQNWFRWVVDRPLASPRKQGNGHLGRLTRRESEIVRLLAEGLEVEEIAVRLSLGAKTTSDYCNSVARKLELGNITRLKIFLNLWNGTFQQMQSRLL